MALCSFETDTETKVKKTLEEIQYIDIELKRITDYKSNLLQKSDEEKALIRKSKSFRSRIRSFPTEVLCRIFQFYIPVSAGHDMETPAHAAPVILGQVCKYWRDVSWSDRNLWRRLRIDLGSDPHPQLEWAIDAHVDRAATEVLTLNITRLFSPSTPQWLSWTTKIVEVISRCKALWVSCEGRHLSWLGGLNPGVFHRLESIFFHARGFGYSSACLDLSTALHLRLAHLQVGEPEELFCFTFSPTTLQDLTCVLSGFASTDYSRSINTWRSFIQRYRDLRSVQARFLGGGFIETVLTTRFIIPFATPVTFTRARALSITIDSHADISAILLNFEFPSLEDLEVVAIKNIKATLLNLLSTPAFNPNLTTLRLIRFNVESTELYSLFRSTTMLTSLDILNGRLVPGLKRFMVDDDELVHKLTIAKGETPLLPHLQHLRLYIKEL